MGYKFKQNPNKEIANGCWVTSACFLRMSRKCVNMDSEGRGK